MTPKSWIGIVLAVASFGLFGLFIHKGCAFSTPVAFLFGGFLLFCGILIDPEDFKQVVGMLPFKRPE